MNLHEIEEAIQELEQGACTYNNCLKLASLYVVRDELRKKGYSSYNYGYYPMYERGGSGGGGGSRSGGGSGSGSSSYGYRRPMYYNNEDDLMIRKHDMRDMQGMMM